MARVFAEAEKLEGSSISREIHHFGYLVRLLAGTYLGPMNNVGCRPLNTEETEKLLSTNQGRYYLRDRALFTLGVYAGFRIGELLSIKLGDVWDGTDVTKIVTVAAQYMKGKKNKRSLPLHEKARTAIREWVLALRAKGLTSPDQALFPRQLTSKPMTRHQARRLILAACERDQIPLERIGLHSLRKSYARRLWDSPLVQKDPARMARLLGHQNWSNTLRYLQFVDLEAAILA